MVAEVVKPAMCSGYIREKASNDVRRRGQASPRWVRRRSRAVESLDEEAGALQR